MTPKEAATALIDNKQRYRVSRTNRCPKCESDSWCLASDFAVLCPRVGAQGSSGKFGEYGHLFLLGNGNIAAVKREPKPPRLTDSQQDEIWRPLVQQWRKTKRLGVLAEELGCSTASLEAIWAGWAPDSKCWAIPEWNAARRILGVSTRYPGGRKLFIAGGRRALTFSEDWRERAIRAGNRVVLVEGASDVAAGLDAGWCTIGRPSNTGGAELLVHLLKPLPREFRVVVMGENDRRPHDVLPDVIRQRHNPKCKGCSACWPGMSGAQRILERLKKQIRCHVALAMPTGGKDLRAMLSKP